MKCYEPIAINSTYMNVRNSFQKFNLIFLCIYGGSCRKPFSLSLTCNLNPFNLANHVVYIRDLNLKLRLNIFSQHKLNVVRLLGNTIAYITGLRQALDLCRYMNV